MLDANAPQVESNRQLFQDFLIGWEAVDFVFAEDEFAVNYHVEDAPAPLDEFCVDARFAFDRIRQPGGLWLIVSLHAIGDGNLHSNKPPFD